MRDSVLIAIGGNALMRPGQVESVAQESLNADIIAEQIADIVQKGYRVVITHGNGPQIGAQLLRSEAGSSETYSLPLDLCVSMTQGEIGCLLQRSVEAALVKRGLDPLVVTLITQVRLGRTDEAFLHPSKPIGPPMSLDVARQKRQQRGWEIIEDAPGRYRRAVSSPSPIQIMELEAIRRCLQENMIIIAAGGGGVPVVRDNGRITGVEAVVDKDRVSALLASELGLGVLLMCTDVEFAYMGFRTAKQTPLPVLSLHAAQALLDLGEFAQGSMRPKIESAIHFLDRGGREAIISGPCSMLAALEGETGTHVRSGLAASNTVRKGAITMELKLTVKERIALGDVIESYLSDLRMEIGDTDSQEYREMLKGRKEMLVRILSLLQTETVEERN